VVVLRLPEHLSKSMFRKYGIKTPEGVLLTRKEYEDGKLACLKLLTPRVVKAQNMIGGRGKAGGIKLCQSLEEIESVVSSLFRVGFSGKTVNELLIEEKIEIRREAYISIAIDRAAGNFSLMSSGAGGVEIESMASEKMKIIGISNLIGLQKFHVYYAAKPIVDAGADREETHDLIFRVYELFKTEDALLTEINPLVIRNDGSLLAADAKIILDDNVVKLRGKYSNTGDSGLESASRELGVNMIELGGHIAVISNGAGEGMATIDQIIHAGGSISHWIDLGGGALSAKPEILNRFIEAVMDTKPTVLLFTAFFQIGKCDLFAESFKKIYESRAKYAMYLPKIILRLDGRNAADAKKSAEGTDMLILDSSQEACDMAVRFSAGGE
jgi:succinyl-CoA synthetase beta subunit